MSTSALNLVQTGVWLIPLILFATLGGLYLLVRHWQRKTQGNLKQLRGELRRIQTTHRQISLTTQAFSPDDPEPFGSHVSTLLNQLEAISAQAAEVEHQHVDLQEEMRRLTSPRWETIVGAPYFWYLLHKDTVSLSESIGLTQKIIVDASDYEQTLSNISWQVALQARETDRAYQQMRKLLDQLHDKNVYGDTIETAIQQSDQIQEALSKIPRYFLVGNQTTILQETDKASAAQIHAILESALPAIQDLSAQAQIWTQQFAQTSERVTIMQKAMGEAEDTLNSMPDTLDISDYENQVSHITVIAQTLRATLSRMEIESMDSVAKEADRITNTAQKVKAQLSRAREQISVLEVVHSELSSGLKQLSIQIASLGTRSTHPIIWEHSVHTLTELNKGANELGPAKERRTPEQVDRGLARAVRLNTRQKALAQNCQRLEQDHAELLALLNSPELRQMNQWLQNAQLLSEQVQAYAPKNWPRRDIVSDLPDDISALAYDANRLIPTEPSDSIQEAALSQYLIDIRNLLADQKDLNKRIIKIQSRLGEIQAKEERLLDEMQKAGATIDQIAYLIRSNTFLNDIAMQEVQRLQENIQDTSNDLSQHQVGTIDNKAREVSSIIAKTEQKANRWLELLNEDTKSEAQTLSTSLSALDAIAPLDEGAVADARRLLSASETYTLSGLGGKASFRGGYHLEELIPEFKRRSDYWQSCAAVNHALEDIEGPILGLHQEASDMRAQVKEHYKELSAWMRRIRDWPPISVSLETESQELDRIEAQWESLKDHPVKGIILVRQLGNLSAKYQALAGKLDQIADRAAQNQDQTGELEAEINESARRWQSLWHKHRDDPLASQEIHALLDDIDHEMALVRNQYKRRKTNYQEALQALKNIHRKARYFQAALDEDHAIDANGNITTRR